MAKIEIEVSENPFKLHIATKDGWVEKFGHIIRIDELKFSAVPWDIFELRISELSTGTKLFALFMDPDIAETPEGLKKHLVNNVALKVRKEITKFGIDKMVLAIEEAKERNKHLGVKPYDIEITVDDVYKMAAAKENN